MIDPAGHRAPGIARALSDGWSLAAPFWRARDQRRAWALLAAVVGLTLSTVWLNVRFSAWNNSFYNTLQNHDLSGFSTQLAVFGGLAAVFIVVAVYRQYLQQLLFMRWRGWLTEHLAQAWLEPGTAYRIGIDGVGRIDNPDQRISEDARGFVSSTLELGFGLLNASVTLLSFAGILWTLSGSLPIPWPGDAAKTVAVPGYMLWVAVSYSLFGTWVAHRLGRPLVGLNGEQQRVEADFRYTLVQVRDHAEAIALARGEAREGRRLRDRFDAVRANWSGLIRTTKRLTWCSAGYGQLANVFPILAAAPRYFSGSIQLGGLMQTAQAFGQVQGALSWFIDAYPRLAEWRATVSRLKAFEAACEHDRTARAGRAIELSLSSRDELRLDRVTLDAPDGQPLARVPGAYFEAGDRVLITGPSGAGKSSLMRSIAGLARSGSGRIVLPANPGLMFVPQRPYLAEGSLREALAYPLDASKFDAQAVTDALLQAGLGRHVERLDARVGWGAVLSPGEQQRLQFARALLHRPDWLFLDESSSALDEAAERELYQVLIAKRPSMTIVSVGHRRSLRPFHDREWSIQGGGDRPAVPTCSADSVLTATA